MRSSLSNSTLGMIAVLSFSSILCAQTAAPPTNPRNAPAKGAPLPKPGEGTMVLLETIQRLGLDVSTHVGLHGGIGPEEDLVKIVGQPTTN